MHRKKCLSGVSNQQSTQNSTSQAVKGKQIKETNGQEDGKEETERKCKGDICADVIDSAISLCKCR